MRILVVMKNWLGDLLFQMPVLDLIQQKYPDAAITCVAPERCREILEAHPAVSGFIPFDEKTEHRPLLSRIGFGFYLKKLGPWDRAYLFHRSRTRALLLLLAGVKERIGYGKGRGLFLSQAIPEPAEKLHQLDYFLNFAKASGLGEPAERFYQFFYKEEDARQAENILKSEGIEPGTRYICFHLGANWEPKRWPPQHFAALAGKIYEKWKVPIVVTGSAQDCSLLDEFIKKIHIPATPGVTGIPTPGVKRVKADNPMIINLVGKTSLRVSAAIYKKAVCLVTGDSGPMHIAAGVGGVVIALFGPTDPKLTGPRGIGDATVLQYVPPGYPIPFFGKDSPADPWLSQITPEQVFAAVDRIFPR